MSDVAMIKVIGEKAVITINGESLAHMDKLKVENESCGDFHHILLTGDIVKFGKEFNEGDE